MRVRLYDLILRCLAPHLEGRLPSGGFASICGTFIGGRHPDTGRHFTIVEPEVGGWGATAERDGLNAQFSILHGDTFNCPAEVAEARYGLYVDRLELSSAPGGEGRNRGGKGILLEYRVRGDGCFLTCAYTRSVHPPWGQAGGRDGSPNFVEVVRARRRGRALRRRDHAAASNAGDVIRIHTGNGGGFGPPGRARRPSACSTTPERLRQPRAVNRWRVAFLPEKTYVAVSKNRTGERRERRWKGARWAAYRVSMDIGERSPTSSPTTRSAGRTRPARRRRRRATSPRACSPGSGR